MYTLVVVDMQNGFDSALGDRVRKNCRREIEKAIQNDAPIVFLEFWGYGPTLPELVKGVLENKAIFCEKNDDDGSPLIEKEVRRNKLPINFKVCGINTDCCVAATVRGLTARFPMSNIEVIADACNSNWYHQNGLNEMKSLKGNVNVISQ